jgi:pilus assembly protein CpaB
MSRRRRAVLLLGLALVLGALAASDVARREAGLRAQLGPSVAVVVARAPLRAGRVLRTGDLALRHIPQRYAPADGVAVPEDLLGQRLAVPVARHGSITPTLIDLGGTPGAPVRRGERAADVVAVASPTVVVRGAHVDVLVTREGEGGTAAGAELALEDVEVLAAAPAPEGAAGPREEGASRVAATLRVTVRQAVYLAAAQAFARDLRLLARAPGDRRRTGAVEVGEGLR